MNMPSKMMMIGGTVALMVVVIGRLVGEAMIGEVHIEEREEVLIMAVGVTGEALTTVVEDEAVALVHGGTVAAPIMLVALALLPMGRTETQTTVVILVQVQMEG